MLLDLNTYSLAEIVNLVEIVDLLPLLNTSKKLRSNIVRCFSPSNSMHAVTPSWNTKLKSKTSVGLPENTYHAQALFAYRPAHPKISKPVAWQRGDMRYRLRLARILSNSRPLFITGRKFRKGTWEELKLKPSTIRVRSIKQADSIITHKCCYDNVKYFILHW